MGLFEDLVVNIIFGDATHVVATRHAVYGILAADLYLGVLHWLSNRYTLINPSLQTVSPEREAWGPNFKATLIHTILVSCVAYLVAFETTSFTVPLTLSVPFCLACAVANIVWNDTVNNALPRWHTLAAKVGFMQTTEYQKQHFLQERFRFSPITIYVNTVMDSFYVYRMLELAIYIVTIGQIHPTNEVGGRAPTEHDDDSDDHKSE